MVLKKHIIIVKDLCKNFRLEHYLNNTLFSRLFLLNKNRDWVRALENINFTVNKGDFIGIIGNNGSGKSTLLKLLAGILYPSLGGVKSFGSIVSFIELGVGFHPELTAKENVYLYGSIIGLNKKKLDSKFDEIMRFAELERFSDAKLKTFSDGMKVRLAFSTAIQADSKIILVDEVLAVGDMNFQKKCFEKFEEFKRMKKTIIFVSHDLEVVEKFCKKILYLKEGKQVFFGNAQKAIHKYVADNSLSQQF